ncbi:MAG: DUF3696 domain-containing protein, partial [Myxococcota bacterium]|nr:DUF3696 domain-containing protein [Myxococcota bacterium]
LPIFKQSLVNREHVLTLRGPHRDASSFRSLIFGQNLEHKMSISLRYAPSVDAMGESNQERLLAGKDTSRSLGFRWSCQGDEGMGEDERVELDGFSCMVAGDPELDLHLALSDEFGYGALGKVLVPVSGDSYESLFDFTKHLRSDRGMESCEPPDPTFLFFTPEGLVPVAQSPALADVADWMSAYDLDDPNDLERAEADLSTYGLSPFTESLSTEFRWVSESIEHIGPARFPADIHVDEEGLAGRLPSSSQLGYLNAWLKRFDLPYLLELEKVRHDRLKAILLVLVDVRTGARCALKDVGFGVSQILPILMKGRQDLYAQQRKTILVEQPELHIHPKLQAELADFFLASSGLVDDDPGNPPDDEGLADFFRSHHQWIIETHSEALVLRLQRRIREGKVKPEDVSILYVRPTGERGSEILQLRLDDDGEFLDEWPDGFFEESYREMFAH